MMARLRHLPVATARARAGELLAALRPRRTPATGGSGRTRGHATPARSGGQHDRAAAAALLGRTDHRARSAQPRAAVGTVRRLVDEGVTILLTTQYLEEADQLADTVAVLDHGRIVAQRQRRGAEGEPRWRGPSAGVRRQRHLPACPRAPRRGSDRRSPAHARSRHRRHGRRCPLTLLGRLGPPGRPRRGSRSDRPSLDDVFLTLTGDAPTHPNRRRSPDDRRPHLVGLLGHDDPLRATLAAQPRGVLHRPHAARSC